MSGFEKKKKENVNSRDQIPDAKFTEFSTLFKKFYDLQIFCFLSIFLYTDRSFFYGYLDSYEF